MGGDGQVFMRTLRLLDNVSNPAELSIWDKVSKVVEADDGSN